VTAPVLGTLDGGEPLRLDLDRVLVSRMLLQANSGAGKSWALRRLLEQTHGRVQHLVLDIEGEFHTLRERFDYILAAKTGGDTLADVRSAPLLARRLLELGVSAILDLYELKAFDRVRFVRLFLEALIDAPRALWHPALVVVDEAHHFCPQTGSAESAPAVIDLMTRGRKRGFCGVLATQRLSKLHKDAAAEANCKLIGRAAMDVDMKRAADELGLSSKEDLARLRTLPPGRFFAFGPGLSDQVVEVQVGDVVTTHPKAGRGAAPVPPPREKVQKVLAQLADLPKQAEEETKTLAQAKARIVELERAARARPAPAAARVERVEVPVLKDQQLKRVEAMVQKADVAAAALVAASRDLRAAAGAAHARPPAPPVARNGAAHQRLAPPPEARPRSALAGGDLLKLGKCERAIIAVLAQHGPSTARRLGVLAGYAWTSGSFSNALSSLRTSGLLEGENTATMQLTQAGAEAAAGVPPLPQGQALVAHWLAHQPAGKCGREVIEVLLEAPDGLSIGDLAASTKSGYAADSGSFSNALSALRTAGILVGRNTELMRLSDELLEAARNG
jgi:hypothetical protein